MSSSPALEQSSPSATTPSSPAIRASDTGLVFQTSTPNFQGKKLQQQPPLFVSLPAAPNSSGCQGEQTLTPPPRSPGIAATTPASTASGDGRSSHQPPDGTSSDKSSEAAGGSVSRTPSTALTRKESYKAQRQHYRREKKRAAATLLHNIEDPAVVVLADWLKVRGSLKSWTKLWCVLKPGLLLLYKSPKAKSSHWVGTVLLTSCQVIERPSKKDGFCFKLYHPLEQSIWAPRGPHNETIGAVVQPLPTAHVIFRAPSPAAGHCWLDGLELALKGSNAMLRCSRSRPEESVVVDSPDTASANLSHDELEKHFNEHELKQIYCSNQKPLLSVEDYTTHDSIHTPKISPKLRKTSKWTQFIESFDKTSKSSDSDSDSNSKGIFDFNFIKKTDEFLRNETVTASMKFPPKKVNKNTLQPISKSVASSPTKNKMEFITKRAPILKYFELPKIPLQLTEKSKNLSRKPSPTSFMEENLAKFLHCNAVSSKRRSSTPLMKMILSPKRISELRQSGAKTDSENDDYSNEFRKTNVVGRSKSRILITKTAPSIERFTRYSSSSTDDVCDRNLRQSTGYQSQTPRASTPEKYYLINYDNLPSRSYEVLSLKRNDDRAMSQNVYVAGKIVANEMASAASDSESDDGIKGSQELVPVRRQDVVANLMATYVEDMNLDVGTAGELVEEVAEENKSLLWFLLKQVRPGMDLSKVVLPTFILEPRSFLDKLSDYYYHADLLAEASKVDDPYQRFIGVLRWYLSGMYRKPKGLKKPYNPVLGEAFRCCWRRPRDTNSQATYYVAEQVSHHPPVSAFYVSNRKDGYTIEGSLLARSKFYGNSTSAILEGCARVRLLNRGEVYISTAPYAHCKGLLIGTLSMELGGKVTLMCQQTGYSADVEFKLRSFLGGADQTNQVYGKIRRGKETVATLEGYWDHRIDIKDKRTGEESCLLDVVTLKERRLPRYLVKLDNQMEHESANLWRHVSEAIHNDDQVAATEQKTIIEERQRAKARVQDTEWRPLYFSKDIDATAPEGIVDQGYRYKYANHSPWMTEEVLEYEENFVIKSLQSAASGHATRRPTELNPAHLSDSESGPQDNARRKHNTTTRSLKHTLSAIDSTLKEQSVALERLSQKVDSLSVTQKSSVIPEQGRVPAVSFFWDLLCGVILAMICQALLNWLFYYKD